MKKVKVSELVKDKQDCPLPLSIIPNNMGINLVSVESISWNKQKDGQIISLSIDFNPEPMSFDLANNFEAELFNLINRHVDRGLSKQDFVLLSDIIWSAKFKSKEIWQK